MCRLLFTALLSTLFFGCAKPQYRSPAAYSLSKPVIINLEHSLHEISGICFKPGDDSTIFAQEDEHGKIYSVNPQDGNIKKEVKFGSKADYEDLAFAKGYLFVLNSVGSVTSISFAPGMPDIAATRAYENILPAAEYEGMAALGDTLYVLCKHCSNLSEKSSLRIFKLAVSDTGNLTPAGYFDPSISVAGKQGKKEKILPSALAYNNTDNQWYVLSGVNKLLMVMNSRFEQVDYYFLDPAIYEQPEGIAFNSIGDLYISNEGNTGKPNILLMKKQP